MMSTSGDKMKDVAALVTIAVPTVNTITGDGVITALSLEEAVFLGMTYGAWFKLGMGIALVLLIIERTVSIRRKLIIGKRA